MDVAPQAEHIHLLFDARTSLLTLAAQRRRFASTVEALSSDELAAPSRCAEWSVADVLRHLVWVDLTVRRIWSGDGSIADGFDPRVTPNEAVRDDRTISDEEIRERYLMSSGTMVTDLESAGPKRFGLPSLSPAGQVPWWMSAVHVGWDSSIHERDAFLPLGRNVERLDDETELCLAYSLVLTSFFAGRDPLSVRVGTIELRRDAGPVSAARVAAVSPAAVSPAAVSPAAVSAAAVGAAAVGAAAVGAAAGDGDVGDADAARPATVVEADDPVQLIDAMSGRGPIEESVRGDADVIRRLGGLARYFTSVPG